MSSKRLGKGTKQRICVGVSGGVDSSVALALLKEQGHDVTGVFIKIWDPELSQCDWRAEMQDAMRVCAQLDVPFRMVDLSDVYRSEVITYMIEAYTQGMTPNPDVMCNKAVKFGAFFTWAMEQGFDAVATGHYATVSATGELRVAKDAAKDQSYFLWNVPKERLKKTRFPVGEYTKMDVRELAKRFNLPTANKADSQGLCFIGPVDVKTFLASRVQVSPGLVLATNGETIGTHKGALLYTLGERHGFSITTHDTARKPYYVVARDIHANTITVSREPRIDGAVRSVLLQNTNWFEEGTDMRVDAVIRYHGTRHPATLTRTADGALVVFDTPVPGVALGQSVVCYQGDVCVVGGSASATS
ncbi:MAG: hypothetical protein RL150_347 [Candidatus Parcubacteria bacterium]|jgi:tRNA-specific 2-thiouridylase